MTRERIGIMGGTFDPIHLGHIHMAQSALTQLSLDRVLMLPSGNPPHKADVTPAEDRYRMVCAACAGLDGLEPCREEIDREGIIYTVDTLSILHEKYPRAELFYLIGTDTLMELQNWRRYEKVLTLCTFVVCPRTSVHSAETLDRERRRLTGMGGRFLPLDMDEMDVSSTEVRMAFRQGSYPPLLPIPVYQYAVTAGLYGAQRRIPQAAQWLDRLFRDLTVKRFAHTLAVAYTARRLALLHHLDADRAEIAGLLHDCAKCMPLKDMQHLARVHHLTEDESILCSGALLHSVVGAYRARADYAMEDPQVLSAIRRHTTGQPGMSRLDMAVWLADTIEPTRVPYPLLEEVRAAAETSLERAMLLSLEGTLRHVQKKGDAVHPATLETIRWLRTLPLN